VLFAQRHRFEGCHEVSFSSSTSWVREADREIFYGSWLSKWIEISQDNTGEKGIPLYKVFIFN
jgi:hypothetical protein